MNTWDTPTSVSYMPLRHYFEDGMMIARCTFADVMGNLDYMVTSNPRINPETIKRDDGDKELIWYELASANENKEPKAYLGLAEGCTYLDAVPETHVATLISVPGNLNGIRLLRRVYQIYRDDMSTKDDRFALTVDPEASLSLFLDYYENLPEWSWMPVQGHAWKSVKFFRSL